MSGKGGLYDYIMVLAGFVILAVAVGGTYGSNIFFRSFVTDLGSTKVITLGAASPGAIMTGFLAIYVGRLNDRYGPRFVLTAGGWWLSTLKGLFKSKY